MSTLYLWLKAIHVLGVVLFLGNIIVTGWWKNLADQTKHPQIIAFAQRQVTLTDYIFTAGGALLLVGAGLLNVWLHGLSLSMPWLMHGIGLFVISGLIWVLILIPVQTKQAKMAKIFNDTGEIPEAYWQLCKKWNAFGLIAVILPVITLYLMVFKGA